MSSMKLTVSGCFISAFGFGSLCANINLNPIYRRFGVQFGTYSVRYCAVFCGIVRCCNDDIMSPALQSKGTIP